uniref:Phage tail tape measure protein, TP901 family, core region n=1 Tax=Candidatus Kentrum sp. TC TaxID=2126339 RepID=A0A451A1D6_9GAMM|nr:MAG: phage tail tape measure protein, TP901 family, core region [Candidatus Kentron sp. TC]VFK59863.1 MAG: phage tail tape measure protein, TP901 family, core region [Candidatus Kentron sp. TC]
MPLLANLDDLRKAFELTSDSQKYAGSMLREYEERSKTTANAAQLFRNRITHLGIALGTILLPPLNTAFDVVGDGQ